MLKDKIEEFGKKYPKFDLTEFIIAFEEGTSRAELEQMFEVTELPLRKFVYSIGLEFPKSKRLASVEDFKYKLGLENGEQLDIVKELTDDIQVLSNKNRKLYKSLTLARDENNALRKESRSEARLENKLEFVLEEIKDIIATSNFEYKPANIVECSNEVTEGISFALLSDIHFSEMSNPKVLEGFNEFNNKLCFEGIDKVFTEVQKYNTNKLRVYLAGDILSGLLHSLDLKGEIPVTQSVVEMAMFLSDRLNNLSSKYEEIQVIMVNGNHSRIKEKPVTDNKSFDFEHLLYEIMIAHLRKDNIKTRYSFSGFAIDNVGTEEEPAYIGIHHGDNRKFNPTQESSVLREFETFDTIFGVRVVSLLQGHTHKAMFTANNRGGNCIVNGCMSGTNEWGFNSGFLPIYAWQWIGVWNPKGYTEHSKCIRIR